MNRSRTDLWGGRLGNRRLYPEPQRGPIAVWEKSERPRVGSSRCALALGSHGKEEDEELVEGRRENEDEAPPENP